MPVASGSTCGCHGPLPRSLRESREGALAAGAGARGMQGHCEHAAQSSILSCACRVCPCQCVHVSIFQSGCCSFVPLGCAPCFFDWRMCSYMCMCMSASAWRGRLAPCLWRMLRRKQKKAESRSFSLVLLSRVECLMRLARWASRRAISPSPVFTYICHSRRLSLSRLLAFFRTYYSALYAVCAKKNAVCARTLSLFAFRYFARPGPSRAFTALPFGLLWRQQAPSLDAL